MLFVIEIIKHKNQFECRYVAETRYFYSDICRHAKYSKTILYLLCSVQMNQYKGTQDYTLKSIIVYMRLIL